jgi:hypothetical protein
MPHQQNLQIVSEYFTDHVHSKAASLAAIVSGTNKGAAIGREAHPSMLAYNWKPVDSDRMMFGQYFKREGRAAAINRAVGDLEFTIDELLDFADEEDSNLVLERINQKKLYSAGEYIAHAKEKLAKYANPNGRTMKEHGKTIGGQLLGAVAKLADVESKYLELKEKYEFLSLDLELPEFTGTEPAQHEIRPEPKTEVPGAAHSRLGNRAKMAIAAGIIAALSIGGIMWSKSNESSKHGQQVYSTNYAR